MRLCILCLFISALKSGAELVDHCNPRWEGAAWQANRLDFPTLAYQAALFPLITQGPGAFAVPSGSFTLRLHVLPLPGQRDEALLTLWGRVEDKTTKPLATLWWRNGQLVWNCAVNPHGDSLFDASNDVELFSPRLAYGCWASVDVLINPNPYEQTFGWRLDVNQPEDPAKRHNTVLHLARQLSVAGWSLEKIEMPRVHSVWFGRMEILPPDAKPVQLRPNILRK